jgi:hypothetical protein
MKNPRAMRERKAKRQAEAKERQSLYDGLSIEEKQKRNPKKELSK